MNDKVFRLFEEYVERKKQEEQEKARAAAVLQKNTAKEKKTKKEGELKENNETPGLDEQENFSTAQEKLALKLGLK